MTPSPADDYREIAKGVYLEGLAVDHRRGIVWYSDPIGGGVFGITPDGVKIASFNEERRWTGGLLVNEDGAVLSTGEGGIMWNNHVTGKSGWLLQEIAGVPINGVNEMMPDGTGGFYFGTSDLENISVGKETRPTSLYRLTVDRRVVCVAGDIGFTNGIMYDSHRRCLYCCDTFRCVWAFDVKDDLSLSNQRLLLEKPDSDGMALDAEGNIWVTGFRSQFLERITPDGKPLGRIPTPPGAVSQLRFGGADMRDFFITVVPAGAGDALKEGEALSATNSLICRGRSAVPGMPIKPTAFKLD
jgi:sugar lactone lactonase YvrE